MLFDRACPQGGWNAGNGVVLGSPLNSHIDTTAIALLALTEHTGQCTATKALDWLRKSYTECSSAYSLAWSALTFSVYRDQAFSPCIERVRSALQARLTISDAETLSLAAVALDVAEGKNNPFQMVL